LSDLLRGNLTEKPMNNMVRKAVPGATLAVVAVLAGCTSVSSAIQSATANPTASADVGTAKARAEAVINQCAVELGGTPGTGVSALVSVPVIRQLATHAGRAKFATCAFPDPAKRAKANTCIQQVITGAGLGLLTHSGRQQAAQGIFNCVETNL
jgi:hypothetical protein